jgi:hypothetical protein
MVKLSFDRELLAGLRKKYPNTIVAFDSEFGVLCVRKDKDIQKALAYAQKEGFPKPYIYDTAANKLIYVGYIPDSPFYHMWPWTEWETS